LEEHFDCEKKEKVERRETEREREERNWQICQIQEE
jgi:hypothetical protein